MIKLIVFGVIALVSADKNVQCNQLRSSECVRDNCTLCFDEKEVPTCQDRIALSSGGNFQKCFTLNSAQTSNSDLKSDDDTKTKINPSMKLKKNQDEDTFVDSVVNPAHTMVNGVDCESVASEDQCGRHSECVWCKSGAIPSACYLADDAQYLPSSIFQCETRKIQNVLESKQAAHTMKVTKTLHNKIKKNEHKVENDKKIENLSGLDCESIPSESSCETHKECVWCKSGAIPSACYIAEEAHYLPPGVFNCNFRDQLREDEGKSTLISSPVVPEIQGDVHVDAMNNLIIEGFDCESVPSESSCETHNECVWCKSGAIPSACYAAEDAHHLPPSVFMCNFRLN